ncbi:MAG: hypothetical protein HRF42_12805 [Candidatus Brocadia sp.]|jgi:hypothetical protein
MGDSKRAVGAGTFDVHPALSYYLPAKLGEFLQKPYILQQHMTVGAGGMTFWLSGTGNPVLVVNFFSLFILFSLVSDFVP